MTPEGEQWGHLAIAGRDIECQWREPRRDGQPTLVFLHEGLGSVSAWGDFPARLAHETGCGILVYSRYGYGKSTVLAEPFGIEYMHREAIETLPAVLADLQVSDPVLVGHSDGASIALIYAGEGDNPVRALVLEAPHVFVERVSVEAIAKIKADYESSSDLRDRLARHHTDPDRTFHGWNGIWLDPEFLNWNIEGYLPGIECPTLVVQGEDDEYGTAAQVEAIERRSGGPVEKLMLENCGHSPHRDQAEATLQAMAAFLEGL